MNLLNNVFKMGLYVMVSALPLLYGCADKEILVDNPKEELGNQYTDVTSVISISGSSKMERPTTRAIDEDGRLTRAVTLNEKFLPISAGSDFTARIFLVKKEDNMCDEFGRLKEFDSKLAAAEIKWTKVTDLPGGGVRLDAAPQKITLHWVNEKSQPVQIKKGDIFYVAGVIGGAYDPALKPGAKYFNTTTGKEETVTASKLYYTSVSFDPYNPEVAKYNNTKDDRGHLRVAAAFVTDWKEIKIAKDGEISLHNFDFKAIGTLFRIKVHRNTDLIDSKAHCYRFVSSQMTASGSFLFGVNVAADYNNVCTKPSAGSSLMSNWYWDNERDETKYFWLNQTEKATGDNDRSYEFHYVYDADKLRQTTQNEEDVFYVWGMPFDKTTEKNARLDNMTCITLEKGGAMLGKKHIRKNLNHTSTTYYADEWCYGDGDTDEWKKFDLTQSNGKAYNVELKVMRPAFSAKDDNGKPKYPWPNQLERFSKTICRTDKQGFADEVFFDNKDTNYGEVKGYTITPRELKKRDINDGGKNTWVYPNFMVPANDQWEVVFPNIKLGNDCYTTDQDWFIDGNGGKGINDRFARKPYEEIYMFDDGGTYPVSTTYEENNAQRGLKTNLFYSFYYPNPCIRELYAIRFDGHATSTDQKEGNVYGRRYRCAYRYRFINTGDWNYRGKDHKKCATFDYVTDKQGRIGRRMVVQSRWIGNAYVPLDSLQSETWWGKADCENAEFSKVDCYRVFPGVGYNKTRTWRNTVSLNYMTRTYFKVDTYFNYKDPNTYADKYFRRFCNDRLGRGHEQNGLGNYYPVMPIIKQDYPEDGRDAPRNRIVPNYNECVRRDWDKDNSWRDNDKQHFDKNLFRVKYRR